MVYKLSRKSLISYPFTSYIVGSYQEAMLSTGASRHRNSGSSQNSNIRDDWKETKEQNKGETLPEESIPYDPIFSRHFSGSFIISLSGKSAHAEVSRRSTEQFFTQLMKSLQVRELIVIGYYPVKWGHLLERTESSEIREWFDSVINDADYSGGFVLNAAEDMGEFAGFLCSALPACGRAPECVLIEEKRRIAMSLCGCEKLFIDVFSPEGYEQVRSSCDGKQFVNVLGRIG